jgi:hypothetical protein
MWRPVGLGRGRWRRPVGVADGPVGAAGGRGRWARPVGAAGGRGWWARLVGEAGEMMGAKAKLLVADTAAARW